MQHQTEPTEAAVLDSNDEIDLFAADRPTSRVVLISSGMADRIIRMRNTHNRPLSPTVVERYRRDMEAGRWQYAADPIRFDHNGVLLDGQHRLVALGSCPGLQLPMLIVTGLPSESQRVMDQGRKRQAAQQLAMGGMRDSTTVAAGVKLHILWSEGTLFQSSTAQIVTAPQIEQWVDDHADLVEQAREVLSVTRKIDVPPSVGFGSSLRFHQIDLVAARAFIELASEPAGLSKDHPVWALDRRLQRVRRDGLRIEQRDYLGLVIQAWNAWRRDRSLTKFQRPRGGRWTAKNFPEAI